MKEDKKNFYDLNNNYSDFIDDPDFEKFVYLKINIPKKIIYVLIILFFKVLFYVMIFIKV